MGMEMKRREGKRRGGGGKPYKLVEKQFLLHKKFASEKLYIV